MNNPLLQEGPLPAFGATSTALTNANVTTLVGVSGQRGVNPGPLRASLNRPQAIAVSPAGVLYITDYAENAILEVR